MPQILRSRLALVGLLGAFLIPIGMSSLRGLTHVLTCRERSETPFTVVVPPEGPPEVLSSTRIVRPGGGGRAAGDICGGLSLDIGARAEGAGKITLILPITNNTENLWRGTVTLTLGDTAVPVEIGEIPAGATETDRVSFQPDEGQTEIQGSLQIGP